MEVIQFSMQFLCGTDEIEAILSISPKFYRILFPFCVIFVVKTALDKRVKEREERSWLKRPISLGNTIYVDSVSQLRSKKVTGWTTKILPLHFRHCCEVIYEGCVSRSFEMCSSFLLVKLFENYLPALPRKVHFTPDLANIFHISGANYRVT